MPKGTSRRTETARRRGPTPADRKLQRWIDLIAALLCRHYGATFEDLCREVPAYAASSDPATRERMFERDKDELRTFGIPIETQPAGDDHTIRYVLAPHDLYLPYLALVSRGSPKRRASVPRAGYRDIPTLELAPDELAAALEAAHLAASLGDPEMKADADAAARKLTFDVGDGWAERADGGAPSGSTSRVQPAHLRRLGEALFRRKHVTFAYRAAGSDASTERTVESYGLFVQSGKWYLAARDVAKPGVRNFRIDRMTALRVNPKRVLTPDYEIPASFRLAEHAALRQAWELGDGDGSEMIVEIRGRSGAVRAAAKLGRPVEGKPGERAFLVRRPDAFARWLLSFGGDIVPVEPRQLVDEWRDAARRTLRLYEREERP